MCQDIMVVGAQVANYQDSATLPSIHLPVRNSLDLLPVLAQGCGIRYDQLRPDPAKVENAPTHLNGNGRVRHDDSFGVHAYGAIDSDSFTVYHQRSTKTAASQEIDIGTPVQSMYAHVRKSTSKDRNNPHIENTMPFVLPFGESQLEHVVFDHIGTITFRDDVVPDGWSDSRYISHLYLERFGGSEPTAKQLESFLIDVAKQAEYFTAVIKLDSPHWKSAKIVTAYDPMKASVNGIDVDLTKDTSAVNRYFSTYIVRAEEAVGDAVNAIWFAVSSQVDSEQLISNTDYKVTQEFTLAMNCTVCELPKTQQASTKARVTHIDRLMQSIPRVTTNLSYRSMVDEEQRLARVIEETECLNGNEIQLDLSGVLQEMENQLADTDFI